MNPEVINYVLEIERAKVLPSILKHRTVEIGTQVMPRNLPRKPEQKNHNIIVEQPISARLRRPKQLLIEPEIYSKMLEIQASRNSKLLETIHLGFATCCETHLKCYQS